MSARQPCLTPGCPELVAGGHCPKHGGLQEAQRPSARERGYGADWDAVRAQVLAEEAACRTCGSTADPHVDHIVPHVPGQPHVRSNLQRLCGECHRSKTNRQDGGFGNPKRAVAA